MTKTDAFFDDLLKQHPQHFHHILKNPDSFRVQIIYTQINRKRSNKPVFKNYYFRVNPKEYFYPASTVKMPIALLALEKLNSLKEFGLNKNISMITENSYSGQTAVYNDPTTPDGRPTIAHYIKRIFLVSDNDASNRLYEFMGQEYLNNVLRKKGYTSTEIIHRLQIPLTADENRHTNEVKFFDDSSNILYSQPMEVSKLAPFNRNDRLGKGYISEGQLINEPFNFSLRNRIVLQDLHSILQSVMFPKSVPKKQRFKLTKDDYRFVRQYMSQYPAETTFPRYDSANYGDGYCKFLYWGSEKSSLPKNLRIFNKVGDAYGFLTDVAYIADFEKNIEFILSATIHCNSDGIYNDDHYDYETVGFPFMKQLGRVMYEYELKRNRKHVPDLSEFKIAYDKHSE